MNSTINNAINNGKPEETFLIGSTWARILGFLLFHEGDFCFHSHLLLYLTFDGFIGDFITGFIEDLNRHRLTKKQVTMPNTEVIITA